MKTDRSAAESASSHRVRSLPRTFLRRRLAAAVRFAVPACLLLAASVAGAGQPLFSPASPAVPSFSQWQSSLNTSANSNQALMSNLIGQLNQNQLQARIAASNFGAQSPVFLPQQTISVRRGK